MYEIHMAEFDQHFARCWQAAFEHLDRQVQGGITSWLRATLMPPFLEHLSFRLGNQLFFLQVVDIDDQIDIPGGPDGLRCIARGCKGHACLLPMRRTRTGWQAALPSWGLIDIDSGAPVDPWDLVDDRPIAMTHWELHDMAVQVVRQQLAAEGREVTAWQGNPDVDPALWCAGPDGPEWVVVRHVLFPATTARRPARLADTVRFLAPRSVRGHFATVSIANQEDLGAAPLRGGPMYARFLGLEPV